jgi:hypothetical protein
MSLMGRPTWGRMTGDVLKYDTLFFLHPYVLILTIENQFVMSN